MNTMEFLRQFRIGQYAIFDFAVSFLGMYILSPLLTKLGNRVHLYIPTRSWLLLTIPMGIVTHLLFGTMTPLTKNFLNADGHYILKIVVLLMIILAIKNIKIKKRISSSLKKHA